MARLLEFGTAPSSPREPAHAAGTIRPKPATVAPLAPMAVSKLEPLDWEQSTCVQLDSDADAQKMGCYLEDVMRGYWNESCGYDQCKKTMCWDCVVEIGSAAETEDQDGPEVVLDGGRPARDAASRWAR